MSNLLLEETSAENLEALTYEDLSVSDLVSSGMTIGGTGLLISLAVIAFIKILKS